MPSSGHSHSFSAVYILTDATRVSTTPEPRLTPGPSDLKATSGVGISAGGRCQVRNVTKMRGARHTGRVGREAIMHKLPARSCIFFFFSVTACISTHQGLCLFTKEITRPEKLFRQMWPRICVRGCETCQEVMCYPPGPSSVVTPPHPPRTN